MTLYEPGPGTYAAILIIESLNLFPDAEIFTPPGDLNLESTTYPSLVVIDLSGS